MSQDADAAPASVARALQDGLIGAASAPLRDDATLLVVIADPDLIMQHISQRGGLTTSPVARARFHLGWSGAA